jgi:hypothetical protein
MAGHRAHKYPNSPLNLQNNGSDSVVQLQTAALTGSLSKPLTTQNAHKSTKSHLRNDRRNVGPSTRVTQPSCWQRVRLSSRPVPHSDPCRLGARPKNFSPWPLVALCCVQADGSSKNSTHRPTQPLHPLPGLPAPQSTSKVTQA